MKLRNKLMIIAAVLLFLLATVQALNAQTSELAVKDKLAAFLTDVLDIDLTNYEVTRQSFASSYPSKFGGAVKEETASLALNSSDGSYITAMVIFDNNYIYTLLTTFYGPVAETQQPKNALESTQVILSNYQTFADNHEISNPDIASAKDMLSSVSDLTTQNATRDSLLMQLSCPPQSHGTQFTWTYITQDVVVTDKAFGVIFDTNPYDGSFIISFTDTWGLWNVADIGISEAEAKSIAWNVAKDCNLTLVSDDNTTTEVQPEWSDDPFTQIGFIMAPGQSYNDSSWNPGLWSMGATPRDGLTLYPLWQFMFYFDQIIGNTQGIQVGVWGDTKEIAYCTGTGVYGAPTSSSTPEPIPADFTTPIVIVAATIIVAVTVAGVYVVKRRK